MNFKRLVLFAGHYGSGKTNIAVNMAIDLKKEDKNVVIADLDIVNPYYRTKDSEEELKAAGIPLISSEYANSNVDVPALPQALYSLVDQKDRYGIMDIGGDDRGALALGRYAPAILEESNYEMLLVINKYRPLTPDTASTLEVMREIEAAGGIPFTGIVNNSNLGRETTPGDVIASDAYAKDIAAATGLPIRMTTVKAEIAGAVAEVLPDVVPLQLQDKRLWND